MARLRTLTLALAGALLVTGPVLASTIVGTSRNDTLRGTPKSDKLYGKAGNDTLFGLRGNDILVGGPGADRLVCGAGRDIARADAQDKVAKDCEIVRGIAPPPPPPNPATPGLHCGSTNQGMPFCFEVVGSSAETRISRFQVSVQTTCRPAGFADRSYELRTIAPVRLDRTFVKRVSLGGYVTTIEGAFDSAGSSATGSISVVFQEDRAGVRNECDSGAVSWRTATPPRESSTQLGTFCGFTDQGQSICLDVTGAPKTVANIELLVRMDCVPPATFGVSSTIPTRYAIGEDGTFSISRNGSGSTAGGGTFTVAQTMTGRFDASGTSAAGTLSAHVSHDASDGTHYECDSGTFAWAAQRQ